MIRLYEEKDYLFVKKIIEQELNYVVDEDDIFKNHLKSINSIENYRFVVYELDGEAVGIMELFHRHSILELGLTLEIKALAVSRNYQKYGIGRKMLEYAKTYASENNNSKIMLVSHKRRKDAHGFYEYNNFERNGYRFIYKING